MLKSLAPMWEEELGRVRQDSRTPGGSGTPPEDEWAPLRPPPSQPRAPQTLSDFEQLREQLAELASAGGASEGGEGKWGALEEVAATPPPGSSDGGSQLAPSQAEAVARMKATMSQANQAPGGSQPPAQPPELSHQQTWVDLSQRLPSQGVAEGGDVAVHGDLVDEEKVLIQIATESSQQGQQVQPPPPSRLSPAPPAAT